MPTDSAGVADAGGEAPAAAGERPGYTHRQIVTVLFGLMLGMLVAALSQTVVATALPTIVGELGGQSQLAWVVSATLLAVTASTPIWGKLGDLYGRKLLFQLAIGIFLLGSVACGAAQNIEQLVAFRAVQGVGMGGIMALTQAIIGDVVPPRERGRYQGYLGSIFGIATLSGPLIGGFLVDHLSWRWCFLVGIPIGAAALIVVQRVLNLPLNRRDHSIDWLGATLIVGGVAALLLVLSLGGQELEWNSLPTYLLAASSVLLLALAVWQERRSSEPIMPPRLFANRTFLLTSLAGLVVGIAMFGAIIFLPQYLQIVQGESPTASGLLMLPLMLGLMTSTIVAGRIITRTGRYKIFPVTGLALAAVGLFLMSRLTAESSLLAAGAFMLVTGLGIGMVMQVLVLVAQNAVDHEDLGTATSGATFFRSMGGAVGVAFFGALLTNRLASTIPSNLSESGVGAGSLDTSSLLGSPETIAALPSGVHQAVVEGFADAMQTVFLAGVPFAVLGFAVVLFIREIPLRTANAQPATREPDLD